MKLISFGFPCFVRTGILALIRSTWGVGSEALVTAFSCILENFCAVWGKYKIFKNGICPFGEWVLLVLAVRNLW